MKEVVIKRYPNRKLYNTETSTYVTLEDIAQLVSAGEEVRILDNKTKKDLTAMTLAQILYEQEKQNKPLLPLSSLKEILRSGGEQIGQIAGIVTGAPERLGKGIEDIQSRFENRIKGLKDGLKEAADLRKEIVTLEKRIETLEKRVRDLS